MRFFVTGGAGFIGSHFCQLATQEGHSITVYDNLSTGHKKFAKFGPFINGDIRDTDQLIEIFKSQKFDAVFHFAGKALVRESMLKPELYYDNNTCGTLSLLKAMQVCNSKEKKLVFSSSCATYGIHNTPIKESFAQNPINPYGHSKKQCEQMIIDFCNTYGLQAAMLRYFNVIGQSSDGSLYEDHEPETHILPNIMKAETAGKAVPIFGDSHNTADGSCVRDYIDVRDLAKIHLAAFEQISAKQVFISNLGQGSGVSINELISTYEEVYSTEVKKSIQEANSGDPASLVADNTFFRSWYKEELIPLRESIRSLSRQNLSQLK